jgi:hypothetical protein
MNNTSHISRAFTMKLKTLTTLSSILLLSGAAEEITATPPEQGLQPLLQALQQQVEKTSQQRLQHQQKIEQLSQQLQCNWQLIQSYQHCEQNRSSSSSRNQGCLSRAKRRLQGCLSIDAEQ